ncbi:alpha/beta fold hydrolase [Muricauda sp. JGD-17]|uniref:Alpha/beta fold hydrolase n=1 Tax=Flagellimonas ochracea TaxID=2696472 RepID=A0A964WYB4_9FLAO|nr:alpha/beta fold hydrolase [Allomuricauda ochracea]NAY92995.1 alpha/beta fold hydrolase [Allomuricauda ochracea]
MHEEIIITCSDGYGLCAKVFVAQKSKNRKKVLIINSATAVNQDLYQNYALYMSGNGFEVITYDYRGIAGSRPKKLRGFRASFVDWAQKDLFAVINYVKRNYTKHSILMLGHSIGGTLLGLCPLNQQVDGILTIGAQTAYYKDWERDSMKLYLMWHIFLPGLTRVFGYFPGKHLGILEDIPKGVIQQWHARRLNSNMSRQLIEDGHQIYFDMFKGKLLTFAITDDPIGTKQALMRVHDAFVHAEKDYVSISPEDVGVSQIGHFGFFSRRFQNSLWPKTLNWFKNV